MNIGQDAGGRRRVDESECVCVAFFTKNERGEREVGGLLDDV